MKEKVAVVIPYYHSDLDETEQISFRQCIKVLGSYPIILVVPESMSEKDYPKEENILVKRIPDKCLNSVKAYNSLMLSKFFYTLFEDYEYILIYQFDAFVFQDKLIEFCDYGYDYIGAPWVHGARYLINGKPSTLYVGNGGFSLRRVEAFIRYLDKYKFDDTSIPEDVLWSGCDSDDIKIAPMDIALSFAFEMRVRESYAMNNFKMPFGCHGWAKHDFNFFKPFIEREGHVFHCDIKGDADAEKPPYKPLYLDASGGAIKKILENDMGIADRSVVVFGAGKIGQECARLLKRADYEIQWVDNDSGKWNTQTDGITIVPPDEVLSAADINKYLILVAVKSSYAEEIKKQLEQAGRRHKEEYWLYDEMTFYILCEESWK